MAKKPDQTVIDVLRECLPEDLAADIITHRKNIKVPLTPRGAKALVRQYKLTGNPEAAAEHHLNMGWRGFEAVWMKKPAQYRDEANPTPRAGGAPQTFFDDTPDHIKARSVRPANHFLNKWQGKQ